MTFTLSFDHPAASRFLQASVMQISQLSMISSASCSCQLRKGIGHELTGRDAVQRSGDGPWLGVVLGVFELVLGDDVGILVEDEETCGSGGERRKGRSGR